MENVSHTAALLAADPRWVETRAALNAKARELLGSDTQALFDDVSDFSSWTGFAV